ncbi:MAG: toll/interleukin-1 receptor domain-containing protein [Bacteroidota bacterium]
MFIVYAREDKAIKNRLLLYLTPFKNAFNLVFWHDEHIDAGEEWEKKIISRIEETDIFLLLVSIDFINSEFIRQVEFKMAIERHKTGKSIVIPIILRPCPWDIDFHFPSYKFNLRELQVLPDEGLPVSDWISPDHAYDNISRRIRTVIENILLKSAAPGEVKYTNLISEVDILFAKDEINQALGLLKECVNDFSWKPELNEKLTQYQPAIKKSVFNDAKVAITKHHYDEARLLVNKYLSVYPDKEAAGLLDSITKEENHPKVEQTIPHVFEVNQPVVTFSKPFPNQIRIIFFCITSLWIIDIVSMYKYHFTLQVFKNKFYDIVAIDITRIFAVPVAVYFFFNKQKISWSLLLLWSSVIVISLIDSAAYQGWGVLMLLSLLSYNIISIILMVPLMVVLFVNLNRRSVRDYFAITNNTYEKTWWWVSGIIAFLIITSRLNISI